MEWQRYLAQGRGRPAYPRPYSPAPRAYSTPYIPRGAVPYQPRRPIQAVSAAVPRVPARAYVPPVRRAVPVPYQPRLPAALGAKGGSYQPVRTGRATDIAHLYEQVERRLTDVCHRYPKLAVSPDFSILLDHWPTQKDLDVPLNVTIPFHTDPDFTIAAPDPEPETPESEPKIIARVMLLSTVKPEEPEDDKKKTPPPHLSKRIKFLVAKKANGGLMSIGGQWSAKKDGADPKTDKALIKTAIRHTKEICGIDLSGCKKWYKFIEVKYKRPSGVEDRTVVFLPDIWNHLASKEHVNVYKQIKREEVEVEEEVEVDIEVEEEGEAKEGETAEKKTVTKKIKKKVTTKKTVDNVTVRSMDLSLNGILEYDIQDKHEETAELSLFAEAFDEFLASRYAKDVLKILTAKKEKSDIQFAELKRKREEENSERQVKMAAEREERDAKRKKLEEERKVQAELKAKMDEEEKNMTEEQIKERRTKEAEEKKAKDEEEKKKREEELAKRKEEEEAKKKVLEEERKKKAEEEKAKKTRTQVVTTTHVDEATLAPSPSSTSQLATADSR
eukprot:TRINITY_DN98_c0_g1_i5.p1 TRINITY_DN98_c0_g1~~TRINITY_DN98_c0_g1_i5.p1  ORF type:complete len:558 (-),score=194.13 TRINITY_DN98_c0_g1_i5:421-2094(-)